MGRLKMPHVKEKRRMCQQSRGWLTLFLCLVTMHERDAAGNRKLAMEMGTNSLYICNFDRLGN